MVVGLEKLPEIRQAHDSQDIVFRAGCYDLLHEGHVKGLEFARNLGSIVVVGLWPDARVRERKGNARPIRPEASRSLMVDALSLVDYALVMPSESEVEQPPMIHVMDLLKPKYFVISAGTVGHPNDERIRDMGVTIISDPTAPPHSTTAIINTILERHNVETSA